MATTYKVWLEVEVYDEVTDTYSSLDLPFGPSAEFTEEDQALAYAKHVHELAPVASCFLLERGKE